MLEKDVVKLVEMICEENNISPPPSVSFSKRMRKGLAVCYPRSRRLKFNSLFCEIGTDEHIRDVILHELAHLDHIHHDVGFRLRAKELGVKEALRSTVDFPELEEIMKRTALYKYTCPNCKKVTYTYRKLKRRYSCRTCGGDIFDERYVLQLEINDKK